MARPSLEPGQWTANEARPYVRNELGKLVAPPEGWTATRKARSAAMWRATGTYRANDGTYGARERERKTKLDAERALATALQQAVKASKGTSHLKSTDTVKKLVLDWFEYEKGLGKLSARSLQTYWSGVKILVGSTEKNHGELGALRVQELTISNMRTALAHVGKEHGPGAQKNVRKVLSRAYGYGIEQGVMPGTNNPVREIKSKDLPSKATASRTKKALAIPDPILAAMLHAADNNEKFQPWDMGDLIRFMSGTGVRIGEALATSWDDVNLRGKRGKVKVGHVTLQNIGKDAGLSEQGLSRHFRKEGTTKEGTRVVTISADLTKCLRDRKQRQKDEGLSNPHSVVFPNVMGGNLRDDSNERRHLREIMRSVPGGEVFTPHNLRDTAATKLVDSGATVRQVADFLGQSNISTTMDRYFSRGDAPLGDLVDVLDVEPAAPVLKVVS